MDEMPAPDSTKDLINANHTAVLRELSQIQSGVVEVRNLAHSIDLKVGGHQVVLDRHDHDLRNLKNASQFKVHAGLIPADTISTKTIVAVIIALSSAVAAAVAAYVQHGVPKL